MTPAGKRSIYTADGTGLMGSPDCQARRRTNKFAARLAQA